MIGIVDYGRGNLRSVEKALEKLRYDVKVMTSPQEISQVQGVILPGVGAFADAIQALKSGGWLNPLKEFAQGGKPFLGICLGMQLLFEFGEEHGEHEGLGFLAGGVFKFPSGLKIPHTGWNNLEKVYPNVMLRNIPDKAHFYFVHSYYAKPSDETCIAATSHYGFDFPALVGQANIWGAQFHPEKSSPWGLVMLDNFGKWVNEQ